MRVLVVDIGGSNVKARVSGHSEKFKTPSGPRMGPAEMVAAVKDMVGSWPYDVVTLGYPGLVRQGHIVRDPQNLAEGWVHFGFEEVFDRPVKIINDAAMQALGSYDGGRMLFLGLGTGLGSALVANWQVVSLALGDIPYRRGRLDDYLSKAGLKRRGRRRWTTAVFEAVAFLRIAFEADYVVIGGGNVDELSQLPEGARRGDNENAFAGGLRLWEERFRVLPEDEVRHLSLSDDAALAVET